MEMKASAAGTLTTRVSGELQKEKGRALRCSEVRGRKRDRL